MELLTVLGFTLLAFAVAISLAGNFARYSTVNIRRLAQDMYANLAVEFYSIAVTVFAIGILTRRQAARRRKEDLIEQMGSPSNDFALEAARRLRNLGALEDGALQGANLAGANLEGADLHKADLQRVNLLRANLQDANLQHADLRGAYLGKVGMHKRPGPPETRVSVRGADLSYANLDGAWGLDHIDLAQANKLRGATTPDGSLYNGRFKLVGDIEAAQGERVNTRDSEAMACWYGVTLEHYERGQRDAVLDAVRFKY